MMEEYLESEGLSKRVMTRTSMRTQQQFPSTCMHAVISDGSDSEDEDADQKISRRSSRQEVVP